MCECPGNRLARVTLALALPYLFVKRSNFCENNVVYEFLKYINENTTYTNHTPTLTQQAIENEGLHAN